MIVNGVEAITGFVVTGLALSDNFSTILIPGPTKIPSGSPSGCATLPAAVASPVKVMGRVRGATVGSFLVPMRFTQVR